jgi:Na+/melibiose symporter-like transporter
VTDENNYERFAKWQSITRVQLGATSNLILGLATGLLAFTTALLLQKKSIISSSAIGFGTVGCIILALSVALALWCAKNRLKDFRLTAQIANPKNKSASLYEWREESKRLGELTWNIFRGQLWSFALGTVGIAVSLVIQLLS